MSLFYIFNNNISPFMSLFFIYLIKIWHYIFRYQILFDLFMSHRKKSDYFTLILRKKWDRMESKMDLNHMGHFWLFYGTINMKYDHLIILMSISSYFSPLYVRIKKVPLSLMQSVTYGVIKLFLSGIQTFFSKSSMIHWTT